MRNLAIRNSVMGGASLPYLRRVEYLESHGTEYIDTGLGSSDGFDFSIDVKASRTYGAVHFFGCEIYQSGVYTYQWLRFDAGHRMLGFGAIFYCNTIKPDTVRRTITGSTRPENTYIIVDGIKYSTGTFKPSIPNLTWGLFAKNDMGNFLKEPFYGRIYNFSMSGVAGSLSFLPVLDLSGRPAMYDEVSGRLFYNQGSGEFTWGELDAASSAAASNGGGV